MAWGLESQCVECPRSISWPAQCVPFVQFGGACRLPASSRLSPFRLCFILPPVGTSCSEALLRGEAKFSGSVHLRTSSAYHMDTGPGIYWRWQQAGPGIRPCCQLFFLPVVPSSSWSQPEWTFWGKQWVSYGVDTGLWVFFPSLSGWDLGSQPSRFRQPDLAITEEAQDGFTAIVETLIPCLANFTVCASLIAISQDWDLLPILQFAFVGLIILGRFLAWHEAVVSLFPRPSAWSSSPL